MNQGEIENWNLAFLFLQLCILKDAPTISSMQDSISLIHKIEDYFWAAKPPPEK